MTMVTDVPLFNDAEAAVRFAFAICELGLQPPPAYLKQLVAKNAKRTKRAEGMSSMDWQAEGMLIRRRVERMPPLIAAYGVSRYSWNEHHRVLVEVAVVDHVAAALPTVRNKNLIHLLVRRYLDQGRPARKRRSVIAVEAGHHHSYVNEVDKRVSAKCDELHFSLIERLTDQMAAAGLIPSP